MLVQTAKSTCTSLKTRTLLAALTVKRSRWPRFHDLSTKCTTFIPFQVLSEEETDNLFETAKFVTCSIGNSNDFPFQRPIFSLSFHQQVTFQLLHRDTLSFS